MIQNQIDISIFIIILFLSIAISFLLYLGVITGVIKRKKGMEKGLVTDRFPDLARSLYNPALMWDSVYLKTSGKDVKVPFPVLRWWDLKEIGGDKILSHLQSQFLETFSKELKGSRIYTGSLLALFFLEEIQSELNKLNATIEIYNPTNPSPPANKVVLYDNAIGTGRTLFSSASRILQFEHSLHCVLALVFNDFVPPQLRDEIWSGLGVDIKFLYTASHLAHDWPEEYQDIALALLTVQDAWNGLLDWNDVKVRGAIRSLGKVLQT